MWINPAAVPAENQTHRLAVNPSEEKMGDQKKSFPHLVFGKGLIAVLQPSIQHTTTRNMAPDKKDKKRKGRSIF